MPPSLKVLVCGTRTVEPRELLKKLLALLEPDDIVISGAARGVDSCAAAIAKARGLKVLEFPANWKENGTVAGPLRNQEMLDQRPDLVIAIHNDPHLGKGTRDMVTRSIKAGVAVVIFTC
jgi:YspA, cpYpsA-related SLOG family